MGIKPKVVVSRCLGFEACRYNAQSIQDDFVNRIKPFVELTTICPEADIGLGTPRQPVRLVQIQKQVRMIQPATDNDVTDAMHDYISEQLPKFSNVDGFIMKGRSPSCGPSVVKVYCGSQKGSSAIKGVGMVAQAVNEKLPFIAMEDEGRLKNFHIREAFLMRLYALARLRELLAAPSIKALTEFHARHKLLLMCFHQENMRQCGRIASNGDKESLSIVMHKYAESFRKALQREPSQKNIINALYHGYGWISDELKSEEKKMFIDAIEEYRDDRITLATLQHLLKSYVIRFEHVYLGSQYFLDPYPRELCDLSNSGH